mmetsp:Transcript_19645/g.41065  ORF Transcript_19645/g.41065 Transcript_19645/m.41065 type:complete len:455 (+) Transcript_19645:192-1556(+)
MSSVTCLSRCSYLSRLPSITSIRSSPCRFSSTSPIENEEATSITIKGAALNFFLSLSKGAVGVMSNSPALISDAAHSLSDIATDVVTLYTHKEAMKPPDWEHPFGHGKYESLGTAAVGGVLIATGGGVGWHSVCSITELLSSTSVTLTSETAFTSPHTAMGVALLSVLAKEGMYRLTLKAGKEANSKVVIANAHHHRSDAYSSMVALVGIGGGAFFGVPWLDPVAGLVVAGMVVKTGAEVTQEAVGDLLDSNVSAELIAEIAHVVSSVPGVSLNDRTKALRARQMGPDILVDVNITVDGAMSASSAHQLGKHVRMRIITRFSAVSDVRIHFDPSNREEFHIMHHPTILPTPDVFESKIRAVLRKCCPEILGVSEILIVYNRDAKLKTKLNILLQPELTIYEANKIATRIREVLMEEMEEMIEVDVDLELSEMDESAKELLILPKEEKSEMEQPS